MNVLSLFDGMSCGQIALERAGVKVDNYYASEIKAHAIKVAQYNYPSTIQLGDVTKLNTSQLPKIDLLIGGSPCQDFSRLKVGDDRSGLRGSKSNLFYEYLRILKEVHPTYFLLENVKMKREHKEELDNYLGVRGININSNMFSFQNRDRFYWTNISIAPYIDKNINFQDYKDTDTTYCFNFKANKTPSRVRMYEKQCPNVTYRKKINCVTCKQDRWSNSGLIDFDGFCRYLTTRELELAQTVPIGYTKCLSMRQAENVLGDGWTVDVIAHILKGIEHPYELTDEEEQNKPLFDLGDK